MSTTPENQEPTVITLDSNNSIQILSQYIELAQQKGAYLLNEAEILKRAMEVLMNNVHDNELNLSNSKQLLIQGVNKGQRHGAYTLNDAALLSKVVQYVANNLEENLAQEPQVKEESSQSELYEVSYNQSDDLSDLAEPIPLKPKEV